jgi:signal transduction histidine kinase
VVSASRVLGWLDRPSSITALAMVTGWFAIYFTYEGPLWLGIALALLTTAGGFLAMRRGSARSRLRRGQMQAAIEAAAARNRELELLRRLGSTLLSVRSSGELLEEVALLAGHLLQAQGSAVLLMAEEGRFLKVAAGGGLLRPATGTLAPVERSLAGWTVLNDQAVICDDMETDPRNFSIDTIPPELQRAICVPLRSSGLVIGAACAYNLRDERPFNDHDRALLSALAEQAAVGLDRAFMLEETRRNERELAEKNRELVRATKMKSEFLANMSHEFRTPLNAIIGFSELLLSPELARLDEQQRDFLESIARNGRHLLGLINNVLDISKIEAGRMTVHLSRLDLRESIRGAVADTVSLRMGKRQTCAVEESAEPLEVVADHVRVRQVLFNLLSNASKFTPESGSINVSAVRAPVPLPVPGERSGERPRLISRDAVWVSVRDSGIGIRPEDRAKLFQVFSQVDSSTSRQQQGSGLGLALCKQFVELHGGSIGAESLYGEGSTFWFILPVEGPIRQRQ